MFAATSEDGLHWVRLSEPADPLLGPSSPDAFDSAGVGRNHSVHASQMLFLNDQLLVWYMGEDRDGVQRIGMMASAIR